MGLSTRELYLILRARDEASRVLRNVQGSIRNLDRQTAAAAERNMHHGQAMTTMGIAIAAAGAVGLKALGDMTDAAIEYNNEAAKTLTQTDGLKVSLQQLADIGRGVAKDIPIPFEQVQSTLYDIFSSMDVNVKGATKLARQFSRDAVGGATDVQTAGRGVITILNAWKIPVKDVTRVSDVMFQLVRKGVGTYQEFASTIGRAIPSAVRAGQSVETLAGMLAFLTRNGLSTAMAATSAARGLDALSNPKAIKNLKKMGVAVVDNKGKFRPLVDIIDDMRKKTEKMSAPQRSKWLTNAFKGAGGTIQAMRFFNLALDDTNGMLPKMVKNMDHAKGAAKDAYKIMSNTPAAKTQLLANKFAILKTEIGDRLIPVKMKLVEWASKLLDAWDKLSPHAKDLAVKAALIGSAFLVLAGAVISVAGIFLMLSAVMTVAGAAAVPFIAAVAGIIAGLTALGVAIYYVIKNWDKLGPVVSAVGEKVKAFATAALQVVVTAAQWAWAKLQALGAWLWTTFGPNLIAAWNQIKKVSLDTWAKVKDAAIMAWNLLKPAFSDFMLTMQQLWGIISMVAKQIWDVALHPLFILVKNVFVLGMKLALALLAASWSYFVTFVGAVLKPLLRVIVVVITGIWGVIKNFIGLVYSILKGDWRKAWEYAQKLVGSIFKLIIGTLVSAVTLIYGIIKGVVLGIINWFKTLYNVLVGHSIIPDLVKKILEWWNKLVDLVTKAKKFMNDVVAAFKLGWSTITKLFSTKIQEVKDKFDGAKKWLVSAGENIISGLKSGIGNAIDGIGTWVKNHIVDPIISAVKRHFGIHSPSTVMAGIGGHLVGGMLKGIISNGLSGAQWVSKIFGSFPDALGSFIDKGITSFKSLPSRLWGTVKGLGGHFATMVKKAQAAKAALSSGGNGGYNGPVGSGAGGIRALARHFNPSYIAGHRDPQGGPAFDIGSSGAKNNNIANALRANHGKLGLRYVISQMRIASARSGWKWRAYTPITNKGDFRHTGHVHVSYANGGWINEHVLGVGQRSGKTYQFGEQGREYVSPEGKGGPSVPITIITNEINPMKHAADLGWLLATRAG